MKKSRVFTALSLTAVLIIGSTFSVSADEVTTSDIDAVTNTINELEIQKTELLGEIDTLDQQLVVTIASIDALDSQIPELDSKIKDSEKSYKNAVKIKDIEYEAMKKRIQYLYENGGEIGWATLLLEDKNITDFLNVAEYTQQMYEYDRQCLEHYANIVINVQNLQSMLEGKKAELVAMRSEQELQKGYLESLLADKKSSSTDYDNQIAALQDKALEYRAIIEEQNKAMQELAAQQYAESLADVDTTEMDAAAAQAEEAAKTAQEAAEAEAAAKAAAEEAEAAAAEAAKNEDAQAEAEAAQAAAEAAAAQAAAEAEAAAAAQAAAEAEAAAAAAQAAAEAEAQAQAQAAAEAAKAEAEAQAQAAAEAQAQAEAEAQAAAEAQAQAEAEAQAAAEAQAQAEAEAQAAAEAAAQADAEAQAQAEAEAQAAAEAAAQAEAEAQAAAEAQAQAEAEAAAAAAAEAEAAAAASSGLGQQVVDYALSWVGVTPYVWAGNSLTAGTDCSGFVHLVYEAFGIYVPRGSYDCRFCGYEVSYADAQPGDIICYDGHVALYIGGGAIVHASDEATGTKISYDATYRPILTVRRVI